MTNLGTEMRPKRDQGGQEDRLWLAWRRRYMEVVVPPIEGITGCFLRVEVVGEQTLPVST